MSRSHADPRRSSGRPAAWRVLRAAAVAILSAYVLYVVAINVFLSSSLFERTINFDPEMLDIHYRKGWSVFPGRIHARDLSIRSSDSNVEWILSLDSVEFDLSLSSLLLRRFDVSRARGHGISMRARQKLDRGPESLDDVRYLPPIPGFPAYSLRPAGPPSLERWFDSKYALWTVQLEDVVAEDVREVWIDGGRFEGHARIAGRFHLKPIRNVDVGPARVDIRTGRVTLGPSVEVASNVVGSSDVTIDRFDPRTVDENEGLLRHLTLATDLRGKLADPASLPFRLSKELYASTEIEARRLVLQVNRGVLARGTHVELGTPRLVASNGNLLCGGSAGLTLDIAPDAQGDRLTAHAEAHDLTLQRTDGIALVRSPHVTAHAEARALDLAGAPLSDARITVDVPHVELADATVLDVYIPRTTPMEIMGGVAHGSGRLEASLAERSATIRGHLQADTLDVRLARMRTHGSFDVLASLENFRWEQGRAEQAKLSAVITDGKLASERDPSKPKIETKRLVVDVSAPDIELADPLRSLALSFVMPEASITDLQMLGGYLPKKKMEILRDRSRFELDGRVVVDDHLARGTLRARSRQLGFALGDVRVRAAVDAHAKVHDWRWEAGDLALDDASVELRGVTITRGDDPKTLARIARVAIGLESPAFAFADPLARVDLRARITGASVADPAALDAFLPDDASYGIASDDGSFEAAARLSFTNHVARGEAGASAKHMGLRTRRFTVHGATRVAIDIARWDLRRDVVALGPSRLAIDRVRGRFGTDATSDLTGEGIELTGRARELDIGHPSLRTIDARLVVNHAEIPDARALGALLPAGGAVRIASGRARASGDIRISSTTRTGSGSLDLALDHGAVAVRETTLTGDFGLQATVRGFDPATSTIDFSGSRATMREVSVAGAAAETAHWRGDVVLQSASLRLRPEGQGPPGASGPAFDSVLRLDADDARPLLGVLLRDSVPKFLIGFADMPRLEAYARVHFSPHALVLSDVSARGGDIALRGTYALYDAERRGAFVVHKGPFSVGLGLDGDSVSPRLFNLDVWLGAQERSVKAKQPREPKR